jgi:hypothetical protein
MTFDFSNFKPALAVDDGGCALPSRSAPVHGM